MKQQNQVSQKAQGKYKYLIQFKEDQNSPSLRKNYIKSSVQRRQNRKSSCSSNRKQRINTDFSPYDDRQLRNSRIYRQQNQYLKIQLNQALIKIESQRRELAVRQKDLIISKQNASKQIRYFQRVINEMSGQIQLVLTKNKILQDQIKGYQAKFSQLKHKQEIKQQQQIRKKRESEISKLLPLPNTRRSAGKLINRSTAIQQMNWKSTTSYMNQENDNTRKEQQLIHSIRSMQQKITGKKSNSLKQLWKWLKATGQSISLIKKVKSKYLKLQDLGEETLRQIISQIFQSLQG